MISEENSTIKSRKISQELEELIKCLKSNLKQQDSNETLKESVVKSSPSFIPVPDSINDIGSVCLMAEPLEEGKILVFSTLQLLEDHIFVSQEILSVLDENFKLVHEKMVEKRCVDGEMQVSMDGLEKNHFLAI